MTAPNDNGWKKRGYVPLWRGFKDDPLWKRKHRASPPEAWLDLYSEARGVDSPKDKPMIFNKRLIYLKRGQLVSSQRELADRWLWSRNSVRNFLEKLKRRGSISIESIDGSSGFSIITISNYEQLCEISTEAEK
jgi:hypothetical protein